MPTIYRTGKTVLPPNKPDERTRHLWEKHRKKIKRVTSVPKRKSN